MLDSKARQWVDPWMDKAANILLKKGCTANQVTVTGGLVGIAAGGVLALGQAPLAVALLWISGVFDALDGQMARISKTATPFGTLLDLVFDRLVEICMILALGLHFPAARLSLLFTLSSFLLSMTIFLAVGACAVNTGKKTFYYQAGLMERTEGFIFLTLMAIFPKAMVGIGLLFGSLVYYTAIQRMLEARALLRE